MTAFGMGYTALTANVERKVAAGPPELPATTGKSATQFGQFTDRLLTFIPGDIVGGYTVVAALAPPNPGVAWTIAIVFTLLAPLVVYWGLSTSAKKVGRRVADIPTPWFRLVAAPIAFFTWMFALPGSPAVSLGAEQQWLRGGVLVVVAIAISALAGPYDSATQLA